MKNLGFFILTYFVLSVNSYIDDDYDYVHFIPETRYVDFLQMNLNFTTKFYKQLTKIETNIGKSIVFSPFSIQSAGASLYAGAKVDSETADEIEDGLKFVSHDNRVLGDIYRKFVNIMRTSTMYKIATKMYISRNYSVSPKFQDVVQKYYLTEIEKIDFNDDTIELKNLINNWITDRTDGKIQNFVQNYDIKNKLAKILLLNVVHFNGEWLKKFDKDKTKKDNFITEPNEMIQVDMMHGYFNFRSSEHKDLNVSLAELTFRNTNMTMIIVVPSSPEIPLKQIEDKLRYLLFEDGIFNKTGYNESRHIIMPKFSIEIELDLEQFFRNLGIVDIFTSEANFSALLNSTDSNIYVSKVLHKTVFNINEDGIASFAQNEYHTRGEHEQEPFIINQSFLYFIRGIHGEIYFMGRFTGK